METEELLKLYARQLALRNYSPRTKKSYTYHVRRFLRWLKKEPRYVQRTDVESWLLRLASKGHSPASVNLAHNSIGSFYRLVFRKKLLVNVPRMKESQQLPKLLSREEVKAMIDNTKNAKHRLLLSFLYSTGLRLSEVRKLKHEHLFPERAYGIVKAGKGNKDRLFHLSTELVKLLGSGEGYVFPGRRGPYSVKSIQMVVKQAAKRAGLNRNVTPHMLRHSYATHLLEQGVDIRLIQELLGHASLNTTQIYTHVAKSSFQGLPNPYDGLRVSPQLSERSDDALGGG